MGSGGQRTGCEVTGPQNSRVYVWDPRGPRQSRWLGQKAWVWGVATLGRLVSRSWPRVDQSLTTPRPTAANVRFPGWSPDAEGQLRPGWLP